MVDNLFRDISAFSDAACLMLPFCELEFEEVCPSPRACIGETGPSKRSELLPFCTLGIGLSLSRSLLGPVTGLTPLSELLWNRLLCRCV